MLTERKVRALSIEAMPNGATGWPQRLAFARLVEAATLEAAAKIIRAEHAPDVPCVGNGVGIKRIESEARRARRAARGGE